MNDYTLESLREHFRVAEGDGVYRPALRRFDAWLAEHDRQVKADAWDEARKAIVRELKKVWPKYATPHRVAERPSNPYSITEENN